MSDKKTCFAITPIGKPGSDVRKYSDQVLKHLIRKAAPEPEYNTIRADEISESGMITPKIIEHILDDDVVIADLTGHNPNVFYELAIRHATRKPFLQLIKAGERIPFDVADLNTIEYDLADPDSLVAAVDECVRQLAAIDDGKPVSSPISTTIDLKALREGDDPAGRSAAQILEAIADLKKSLRHIVGQIADTATTIHGHRAQAIRRIDLKRELARAEKTASVTLEQRPCPVCREPLGENPFICSSCGWTLEPPF